LVGSQLIAAEQAMVSVEVVPLTHGVLANEIIEVAVIFSMEPGWYTYWQNPGEAGMPTSFEWSLPRDFKVINRREPVPTRHIDQGITTFILDNEALYLFSIQAPAEIPDSNVFALDIQWLECKDLCQPGSSKHRFMIPTSNTPSKAIKERTALLKQAEKRFPDSGPISLGTVSKKENQIELAFRHLPWDRKLLSVDFFPYDEMVYDLARPVHVKRGFGKQWIIIPLLNNADVLPESLHGVLVQTFASPGGPITTHSIVNQPFQ
jgi:thiol:disulfide interchange protein DsbD